MARVYAQLASMRLNVERNGTRCRDAAMKSPPRRAPPDTSPHFHSRLSSCAGVTSTRRLLCRRLHAASRAMLMTIGYDVSLLFLAPETTEGRMIRAPRPGHALPET